MRSDSTVFVIASILSEGDGHHRARFVNLNVLVFADGGWERTKLDHARLSSVPASSLSRYPTTSPMSLLEGLPG